jgi:DNA-binding IclR family transcriptional regulator
MPLSGNRSRNGAGAQTVDRACHLLNEIARHGQAGARLVDLTRRSKLSRPTVHRILQSLSAARLVHQDAATRHYRLGVALHALALAAPSPLEQLGELRPLLVELAQRTGETGYLMLRQGSEALCVARAESAAPIRTVLIDVGAHLPLGATIAGIAMLAALDDKEIEDILRRTAGAMSARHRNATPDYVRRQVAHVRRHGFCVSKEVLIEGATGFSAAVPRGDAPPFLAVSVSAVSTRVPESRVKPLAADLMRTCARMGQLLARDARRGGQAVRDDVVRYPDTGGD